MWFKLGKEIEQANKSSQKEINSGRLSFQQIAIEDYELDEGEKKFDLIFAIRVGALDGRHPDIGKLALRNIGKALKRGGHLFVDGIRH